MTNPNPFGVLGLEARMGLCPVELEERYLELSRAVHPDLAGGDAETQAVAIAKSAALNDAYRELRDPWIRAERLAEGGDPGCMDRTKRLPPMFLMEAMELAEQVAGVDEGDRHTLHTEIDGRVAEYLQRVTAALDEQRFEDAAVLLHESRYYRKALHDLDEPDDLL